MNNVFKFLLILFIGMMSMKGFSATTDLGQDSIVTTISLEDDVGTDVAQLIIVNVNISTEVKTQQVYIRKTYRNISKYYFHNYFIHNNKIKTYKPPTKYNNIKVLILDKDKELA